ncbi:hypothetical protein VTN77DRAFT_1767 [Rasamsonia byssochlamydoides]|uniref:mitochondrial 37S ribosomal protein bS1m n=1 Tax=Rasamsonia byssochlamydoides TaxID=89139 RepID=UPI0037443E54
MAAARLSPTANLLRKSRLFALPPALSPPQDAATSRTVFESDTATLPHPVRAAIETPASSLARGDWGLKRPLPAKSTTDKSSRPVVRVNAIDTFEHVTDFESAADHTVTLQKFQELNLPMSLPSKVNYGANLLSRHQSPFDALVDNTDKSEGLKEPGAKQFRHSGPWLAGQSELEFQAYLERVRRKKPELLQKLRERYIAKRTAERRKQAQDNGEDLEGLNQPVQVTDEEFRAYIKSLRADPVAMGPVVFDLLDLPSPPAVPSDRIGHKYFAPPGTKLSSAEYAISGPPKTHPSAGLTYSRSHAMLYNHPKFGPQAHQRPVEARVLLPKKRYRGRMSRAIVGVAGIALEDVHAGTFADQIAPPGLTFFDSTIPGGAKYWATPIRASVDSEGRIGLVTHQATATAKAPYGMTDYKKPGSTSISNVARGAQRTVPQLDRISPRQPRFNDSGDAPATTQPARGTEDIARNLLKAISS